MTGPQPAKDFDDIRLVLPRVDVRLPDPAGDRRAAAVILYDGDEIDSLHSLTKDETVIGRTAGADIVIPGSRVSRRHAVIRRAAPGGDDFELIDLGSTNGTFVDGQRVKRVALTPGSKAAIGDRILKFEIADRATIACQSRIVQMIHLDELTGLLTKRSLFRALGAELLRTERFRHPLSVLMMDLDHFRLINDAFGHVVGSHCLSEVGALIRETVRVSDVSGRYGGEEFVSFLPETDTATALMIAERVREAFAARYVRVRRDDLPDADFGRHRDLPGRWRECGRARSISRDRALPRQGARSESLRGCGSQGLGGSRGC